MPAARYAYEAFGSSNVLSSQFGTRSVSAYSWETRFGSYRFEPDSGLYYVRQRYLNPQLGRWLSRDQVLGLVAANLYRGLKNAPPMYVDPYGEVELTGPAGDPWDIHPPSPDETFQDPKTLAKNGGGHAVPTWKLKAKQQFSASGLVYFIREDGSPSYYGTYTGAESNVYHEKAHVVNGAIAYEHARDGIAPLLNICHGPFGTGLVSELVGLYDKAAGWEEDYLNLQQHVGNGMWGNRYTSSVPEPNSDNRLKHIKSEWDKVKGEIARKLQTLSNNPTQ